MFLTWPHPNGTLVPYFSIRGITLHDQACWVHCHPGNCALNESRAFGIGADSKWELRNRFYGLDRSRPSGQIAFFRAKRNRFASFNGFPVPGPPEGTCTVTEPDRPRQSRAVAGFHCSAGRHFRGALVRGVHQQPGWNVLQPQLARLYCEPESTGTGGYSGGRGGRFRRSEFRDRECLYSDWRRRIFSAVIRSDADAGANPALVAEVDNQLFQRRVRFVGIQANGGSPSRARCYYFSPARPLWGSWYGVSGNVSNPGFTKGQLQGVLFYFPRARSKRGGTGNPRRSVDSSRG